MPMTPYPTDGGTEEGRDAVPRTVDGTTAGTFDRQPSFNSMPPTPPWRKAASDSRPTSSEPTTSVESAAMDVDAGMGGTAATEASEESTGGDVGLAGPPELAKGASAESAAPTTAS